MSNENQFNQGNQLRELKGDMIARLAAPFTSAKIVTVKVAVIGVATLCEVLFTAVRGQADA